MRTQISQMIKVVQKRTAALLMLFFGKTKPAQVVQSNTASWICSYINCCILQFSVSAMLSKKMLLTI